MVGEAVVAPPSPSDIPVAAKRSVLKRTGSKRAASKPAVTEPIVAELVVTEPTVPKPVVTEPVLAEPVVMEAVAADAPPADAARSAAPPENGKRKDRQKDRQRRPAGRRGRAENEPKSTRALRDTERDHIDWIDKLVKLPSDPTLETRER
jgi:hypothetical protein